MADAIIEAMCVQLKLGTFGKNYAAFAKDASKSNKPYEAYLKALMEEEILQRSNNRIKSLISNARFPNRKSLGEFKFDAVPKLSKAKIRQLSDCHYIDQAHNICFMGQTGLGKTHLAIALGLEACKKKYRVLFYSAAKLVNEFIEARADLTLAKLEKKLAKADLIVLDELGYIPFSKEGAEHLFQFFANRYERGSIIVTTNLEFSDWTHFMGDSTMTSALLDRFTHHCEIFTLIGESYRFKQQKRP